MNKAQEKIIRENLSKVMTPDPQEQARVSGLFNRLVPETEGAKPVSGMTASEVIKELQQVSPDTQVTIATKERNGIPVMEVRTLGYCGGKAVIATDD